MADIQFSVECITGGVHIRQRPLVYFYLYNRGANDEYAEALRMATASRAGRTD